jgi:hypothetical protein
VTLKNRCFGAAVILIYSGIDAMAFLAMPQSQEDFDFIAWTDRYIRFSCKKELSGTEVYGAGVACCTITAPSRA